MNEAAETLDYVDVLIVGAGLSGIGAAYYIQRDFPGKTYALLEARQDLGGTWDLFRYPGIRSDSDMYTLGYAFKPWTNPKAIADGPAILSYIKETARENDIERHIRYNQKAVSAAWDSVESRWTVTVVSGDGDKHRVQCNFLYMCSGYYSYDNPYTPTFAGQDGYSGALFHAQLWPEGLDYAGKRVVVVGSGATAVTLVPEMSRTAASTIMLQRSPTYMVSLPEKDPLVGFMRKWLPMSWVYHSTRWKNVLAQQVFFKLCRKYPEKLKGFLIGRVRQALGKDYDVATHFTPRYNPWDERLCAVPDADMFDAIREQRVEVVTDHIERFTSQGIQLQSGRELQADIVVLATGLNLEYLGGIELTVDDKPVDPSQEFLYRGMMLSNVPNMAQAFGYTNASWTLKADLTAEYVCRLLRHMDDIDGNTVIPVLPAGGIEEEPMLDFTSGYVQRAMDRFPKQGQDKPWRMYQNYFLDLLSLRLSRLTGNALKFRP